MIKPTSPDRYWQIAGAPALLTLASLFLFTPVFAKDAVPDRAGSAGKSISSERLLRIDEMAREYVDERRLPGAVFAVAHRGRLAHIGRAGPPRLDSIFRIYSMTKPVTVVAVLILYEEGRFLLTDPVARYLPEFADMRVYLGTNEETGQPETRAAANPITIEDLLTHTAGLTYDEQNAEGVPGLYAAANIWSVDTLAEFSERVAALPLVFEPGTRWHYSVANDVLGRLVEVVAGMPFDEFLETRILAALEMRDTAFYVPDSKLHRFLAIYQRDGDGMRTSETAAESEYRNAGRVPFGGGGLVSTATDYLRFAQMLLNKGQLDGVRIIGRKTTDLMMMDHLGANFARPHLNEIWVSQTENRTGDTFLGLGFGFGGYVITDVAENDVPGSTGTYAWGGAASTYFFVDPSEELIGLFLTQLTPSSSYPVRAQFRGLVYQALE